jgi:hypothetical protein
VPNATLPDPVGVGYFPKRTQTRPEWLKASVVREICSVSECISSGPEGWIEKWLHNALGFYESEDLAWQVVGPDRGGFDMYAYKAYPLQFDDGAVGPWQAPVELQLELSEFVFLGFDLVSRSTANNFECSALSCNSGADEFPVNRFCLMDDSAAAFEACTVVSKGAYEPGPYHLLEVYRRRQGG